MLNLLFKNGGKDKNKKNNFPNNFLPQHYIFKIDKNI